MERDPEAGRTAMTSLASRLDEIDLTSVEPYQERGYPWAEWALLRREAPVYWYERGWGGAVLVHHEA